MKSMIRRPSLALPAGLWKKVSPNGSVFGKNAADIPPVSELESPKLNIAGTPLIAVAMTSSLPTLNTDETNKLKVTTTLKTSILAALELLSETHLYYLFYRHTDAC